jgi:hypothetical protein
MKRLYLCAAHDRAIVDGTLGIVEDVLRALAASRRVAARVPQ